MAVYISLIASITPQICSEQATRQPTTTTISERPKMRTIRGWWNKLRCRARAWLDDNGDARGHSAMAGRSMSDSHPSEDSPPRAGGFMETRWTLVLRARGQSPAAQSALGELCKAYYAPVLMFIRQTGRPEEAARDLTQEFFARLVARHGLDGVQQDRGRFRSFLLGAVKHFLAGQRDREHAAKRGGGQVVLSIEAGAGTGSTSELPLPDQAGQGSE